MTDLTEKWKKGKLPYGDYYIKRRNGYTLYDNIDSHGVWRNSIDEDIEEVLAPVPSYEEWWKLNQLLGKCYRFLRLTETKVEAIENVKRGLVKEIDEVLE